MFAFSPSGSHLALAACFSIFFIHWTSGQANYCAISSCSKGQQTMCLFPTSTPSSKCVKYQKRPLNSQEITAIVNRHNQLRRKVASGGETQGNPGPQPPASNMQNLVWDAELAKVAQRWADQCTKGHDKCRNVARYAVGQNIVTFWSTGELKQTVEEMMQGWYDEVKIFSKNNIAKFQFAASWGHYSQLVWAETSSVGCGRVRFFDTEIQMNCIRLVCNYGPTGERNGVKEEEEEAGAESEADNIFCNNWITLGRKWASITPQLLCESYAAGGGANSWTAELQVPGYRLQVTGSVLPARLATQPIQ